MKRTLLIFTFSYVFQSIPFCYVDMSSSNVNGRCTTMQLITHLAKVDPISKLVKVIPIAQLAVVGPNTCS